MAHQMNQPMRGMEQPMMPNSQMMGMGEVQGMDQQMMNSDWESSEVRPMEPWQDETMYSMPADMGMQQNWGMQSGQMGGMGASIPGMGGSGTGGGQSGAFAQSQRMKNPVDMETTHTPINSRDAYQASLRSLLARNVGYFIVATFLTGTQRMVTWQGILHTVGSDYLVIYQPDYERYISCDFYALKFVQFHNTQSTPYCASSHTWMGREE
ncbi:MAG: hypothetical protein IJ955_08280 [Oscillospiraceae bacterium]|nr:hypothetical protein [Oscillospiraceae bacterium]